MPASLKCKYVLVSENAQAMLLFIQGSPTKQSRSMNFYGAEILKSQICLGLLRAS